MINCWAGSMILWVEVLADMMHTLLLFYDPETIASQNFLFVETFCFLQLGFSDIAIWFI